MKTALYSLAFLLSLLPPARAATITNSWAAMPAQPQCGQLWTNQNIILHFTPTIASEDGSSGSCSFGFGAGFIWLYPCRLHLDFSQLPQSVTKVEADIYDQCGTDCTKLFAYHAASQIAVVGNPAVYSQKLSLTFSNTHPDSCVVRSFEAKVFQIRITTEDAPPKLAFESANGSLAISWPTNATSYALESTQSFPDSNAWAFETNNIQTEGTNFVYRSTALAGRQFFRLRHN